MNAAYIAAHLDAYRFAYADEMELHEGIAQVLALTGADVQREVSLPRNAGRIDFLVDAVGIEVKVQGSPAQINRQLRRYAACPQIEELVLVTNRPRHVRLAGPHPGANVTVVVLV